MPYAVRAGGRPGTGAGLWRCAVGLVLALLCSLALSPAGAEAAFAGANGRVAFTRFVVVKSVPRYSIHVVWPGGGERRLIAGGQSPAWAPDGRHLAYVVTGADGRGRRIAIADAGGGDRRMVTGDPADATPAWSPDGRWLVFQRDGRLRPGVIVPTIEVVRVDGARGGSPLGCIRLGGGTVGLRSPTASARASSRSNSSAPRGRGCGG